MSLEDYRVQIGLKQYEDIGGYGIDKNGVIVNKAPFCFGRGDGSFWMLETDKGGLERVIGIFEQNCSERDKGIINAYKALTIPESKKATIQIGNHNEQDKKDVEAYIKQGVAERFGTAKIEGDYARYPNLHLEIWHPEHHTSFLQYAGCDEECSGDIYFSNDKDPEFGIHRKSWKKFIDLWSCERSRAKTEEEKRSAENSLTHYNEKENEHLRHEEELLAMIKDIKEYLPELKNGIILRGREEIPVKLVSGGYKERNKVFRFFNFTKVY